MISEIILSYRNILSYRKKTTFKYNKNHINNHEIPLSVRLIFLNALSLFIKENHLYIGWITVKISGSIASLVHG